PFSGCGWGNCQGETVDQGGQSSEEGLNRVAVAEGGKQLLEEGVVAQHRIDTALAKTIGAGSVDPGGAAALVSKVAGGERRGFLRQCSRDLHGFLVSPHFCRLRKVIGPQDKKSRSPRLGAAARPLSINGRGHAAIVKNEFQKKIS